MPEYYLLTLAVHGNMGDGELPDLIKNWAKKQCAALGLGDELKRLQIERHTELKRRLRNALGDDLVDEIDTTINQVMHKLTSP